MLQYTIQINLYYLYTEKKKDYVHTEEDKENNVHIEEKEEFTQTDNKKVSLQRKPLKETSSNENSRYVCPDGETAASQKGKSLKTGNCQLLKGQV